MALPPNPQRVALATDAQGKPVYITREWLRFIADATGTPGGTVSAPTDLTAVIAQINALQAQVTALVLRIETLEMGYQI